MQLPNYNAHPGGRAECQLFLVLSSGFIKASLVQESVAEIEMRAWMLWLEANCCFKMFDCFVKRATADKGSSQVGMHIGRRRLDFESRSEFRDCFIRFPAHEIEIAKAKMSHGIVARYGECVGPQRFAVTPKTRLNPR